MKINLVNLCGLVWISVVLLSFEMTQMNKCKTLVKDRVSSWCFVESLVIVVSYMVVFITLRFEIHQRMYALSLKVWYFLCVLVQLMSTFNACAICAETRLCILSENSWGYWRNQCSCWKERNKWEVDLRIFMYRVHRVWQIWDIKKVRTL